MHRLNSFARASNAYVQDRFAQLIDICWPSAAEVQELDEESVAAAKQRLMAVRKAFYEDWKQDKTLDLFKSVVDEGAFEVPDHFALLNEPATPQERGKKEARLLQLRIRPLWYATPADADGKPDHSLLEQILKLAIAVARRQVVFG